MTSTPSNSNKFPLAMRILHWTMAVIILGLLALGLYIHSIPLDAPGKFDLYHWHRAFGVVAFLLVIARLIVRFRANVPSLPKTIPHSHRRIAEAAQISLYVAMLAIPVFGYIASSALPEFPGVPPIHSIWFFGLDLPLFPVEKDYKTTTFFIALHKYVGYAMMAILVGHLSGVIKHRFFDKPENDVLPRMI